MASTSGCGTPPDGTLLDTSLPIDIEVHYELASDLTPRDWNTQGAGRRREFVRLS